ncbi:hypothetical protein B0G84_6091 [Paraburkholderia sp. BL8N3]|nr:hypothetical protein B0G84_6091 [Paraburkholderia sp. BL8N3]
MRPSSIASTRRFSAKRRCPVATSSIDITTSTCSDSPSPSCLTAFIETAQPLCINERFSIVALPCVRGSRSHTEHLTLAPAIVPSRGMKTQNADWRLQCRLLPAIPLGACLRFVFRQHGAHARHVRMPLSVEEAIAPTASACIPGSTIAGAIIVVLALSAVTVGRCLIRAQPCASGRAVRQEMHLPLHGMRRIVDRYPGHSSGGISWNYVSSAILSPSLRK